MTTPPPSRGWQTLLLPLQAFFALEAAAGLVLLGATAVALGWANSPWSGVYTTWVNLPLRPGNFTVLEMVNEGLMTLFFFVVGMEIKRERVQGELQQLSQALLPLAGALGGMLVPAGIYTAFNAGGPGAGGWGIPMATDIAFAVGVLTLLRSRIPPLLPVFLLVLAVFDDLGGILVIALFYGKGMHGWGLASALGLSVTAALVGRSRLASVPLLAVLGVLLWLAFHAAGLHTTLAGVVLGFCVPSGKSPAPPLLERLIEGLHPFVAFGVVPLFALCNAGISLAEARTSDLSSPVFLGTLVGLVVGKPVGVLAFTSVARRLAHVSLPGVSLGAFGGVGAVAGIGFTVALFIAQLAFQTEAHLLVQAKLGILLGSVASAGIGYVILRAATRTHLANTAHLPEST